MEQGFVDRLKKLIDEQGKEALLDPKIFNKYINDYRGSEYKKESQKLVEALEAGIAKAIDGADDLAACKKAKIRDLEQELSPALSSDIVNTLALLLRGDTTVTASAEDAQELNKKGYDAYNRKDYTEAFKCYSKAAEQGYADAQNRLGLRYDNGEGVPQDKAKAVYWYTKAAEQGNTSAQNSLGYCHQHGEGVPQDKAKAVYWYTKAAEQGNASAQNNLGYCYQHGEGVPQDKAKAVYWYTKAAEQGNASAQYNLGSCYDYGQGVPRDKSKAVYWYTKAAEQGHADAQKRLDEIK